MPVFLAGQVRCTCNGFADTMIGLMMLAVIMFTSRHQGELAAPLHALLQPLRHYTGLTIKVQKMHTGCGAKQFVGQSHVWCLAGPKLSQRVCVACKNKGYALGCLDLQQHRMTSVHEHAKTGAKPINGGDLATLVYACFGKAMRQ